MGINARWEDERGDELDCLLDARSLMPGIVSAASPQTICLRFIDPYGDTVFNRAQIEVLRDELSWIQEDTLSVETRQHLARLVDLVEQARGEVHTYIRFVGD